MVRCGYVRRIITFRNQQQQQQQRQQQLQQRVVFTTMLITGSLLCVVYVLTLSCCCVGVEILDPDLTSSGSARSGHTSRVILIRDGDEDEARYQRDLDHIGRMRGRTLLSPGSEATEGGDATVIRKRTERRLADAGGVVKYGDDAANDDEYDDAESAGSYRLYDVDVRENALTPTKRDRTRRFKGDRKRSWRRLPQAIIIGVKKGGTRALLEYLRIHPDVRAPGPEPHFFDRNYDKGLDWYRRQMPPTYDNQLTMEKTPSYFVTKGVPSRIFNMSKETKFIVVVRDPVTRAVSDYTQALAKRNDVDTFEAMAFEDNSTGLVDTSWGAIRIGVYAKHLERWLQYFPLSQVHFVSGERLISDPAGEMEKVQDFLGISRAITEKNFVFNSTKGFPCLVRTPGGAARRPHCLGKSKGREHPKIDPKVITRLRDFFRPFNQKFYQMVGQDFGWS